VGEWVLAVGNPLQEQLSFTVTSGIVSAKGRGRLLLPGAGDRNFSIQDFIQTDAAINRGNSGGPLLNVRGEVIGVNSAIFSQTGFNVGYAFAIPIDLAKQVMEQLISRGRVERSALGVSVNEVTQEDADYVKLPEIRGVKVEEFSMQNSPAERAGLQPGDIIITIDGQPVEYVAQLQQVVGFKRPGETVKVEVARKGGLRRIYNVRLEAQREATELASQGAPEAAAEPAERDSDIKERLGITVTPLTAEVVRELNTPANVRGLLVEEVDPYGPADGLLFPPSAGGSIITAVEGNPVRTEADLRAALKGVKPGEIVSLTVFIPAANNGRGQTRIARLRLK
jgi:serine protease Do